MIKLLDIYIARTIIGGTLLALLMLTSLDVIFSFIAELDAIGRGDYGFIQALVYTALTIPRRIYDLFPSAVLLGALLGLGALATHSELIAMRAAGMSIGRIIRSALQTGVVMMLCVVMLGEIVAPASEARAQTLRTFSHSEQMSMGYGGLWVRDGNRYLNVNMVMAGPRLVDLRVYEFTNDKRLASAMQANSASYDHAHNRWIIEGIARSHILHETGVTVEHVDKEYWPHLLAPELLNVIVIEPQQMSALALLRYINYLSANNLDAKAYELAFWNRFTQPLSSLVMLLLAIPFVFGSLRSGGAGQRIFIGIVVGAGFHLLNRTLNHMGLVYGLAPLLSAALPSMLFLLFGILAVRKMR